MKENKDLVSVYSGTEASVLLLKGKLDRMGIASEIRKESNAGTWGIIPDNIELLIDKSNREEAGPLITSFLNNAKVEKL